jgi:hypothetical protein
MIDRPDIPPGELIEGVRGLASDLHHGLRQGEAIGNADVYVHYHRSAEGIGASPEELAEIKNGLMDEFRQFVEDQGARRRRRRLRWPARSRGDSRDRPLPSARPLPQLELGMLTEPDYTPPSERESHESSTRA